MCFPFNLAEDHWSVNTIKNKYGQWYVTVGTIVLIYYALFILYLYIFFFIYVQFNMILKSLRKMIFFFYLVTPCNFLLYACFTGASVFRQAERKQKKILNCVSLGGLERGKANPEKTKS